MFRNFNTILTEVFPDGFVKFRKAGDLGQIRHREARTASRAVRKIHRPASRERSRANKLFRELNIKATGIDDLADQGFGILLVSSEMQEVLSLCDRILVMKEGRIRGELSGQEATQEKILALAMASAAKGSE